MSYSAPSTCCSSPPLQPLLCIEQQPPPYTREFLCIVLDVLSTSKYGLKPRVPPALVSWVFELTCAPPHPEVNKLLKLLARVPSSGPPACLGKYLVSPAPQNYFKCHYNYIILRKRTGYGKQDLNAVLWRLRQDDQYSSWGYILRLDSKKQQQNKKQKAFSKTPRKTMNDHVSQSRRKILRGLLKYPWNTLMYID